MRTIFTITAAALLAGCAQDAAQENEANTLIASPETRTGGTEPDIPLAVPVDAETAKRLMAERHENYEKIGDAMKLVTRELKSDSPDLSNVRKGAGTIATLAPLVPSWFPAGTGPDVGKTEAKAVIWERPEDFQSKAQAFEQAAAAFRAAAQGSDLEAIRAAHADLGKACKACHDLYREKD
ncbi:MAG TPA: cytochrome c [Sphingomicrobium sp.]|nr:cytochrome c [Sphingomicrobium sp.]